MNTDARDQRVIRGGMMSWFQLSFCSPTSASVKPAYYLIDAPQFVCSFRGKNNNVTSRVANIIKATFKDFCQGRSQLFA